MRLERHLTDGSGRVSTPGAGDDPFSGTWTNELGSTMELEFDPSTGSLSGTYHSAVADTDEYRLTGAAGFSAVGFTVAFWKSAAVGSWVGHLDGGELHMLWHLAQQPADDRMWNTTVAGYDVFHRS